MAMGVRTVGAEVASVASTLLVPKFQSLFWNNSRRDAGHSDGKANVRSLLMDWQTGSLLTVSVGLR